MGAYGHHRGTGDLDIFVIATDTNSEKLVNAPIDYGIPEEQLKKEMFLVPKMIGIGEPPLRIELLKKLDTLDFEYASQRVEIKKVVGWPRLSAFKQRLTQERNFSFINT